jgi:hypothetical protein
MSANLPSVQMKPVDICALKPVTVALPQRILTAFPFHPNHELVVRSSGTGDALFNYREGYVAGSVQSNVLAGGFWGHDLDSVGNAPEQPSDSVRKGCSHSADCDSFEPGFESASANDSCL